MIVFSVWVMRERMCDVCAGDKVVQLVLLALPTNA